MGFRAQTAYSDSCEQDTKVWVSRTKPNSSVRSRRLSVSMKVLQSPKTLQVSASGGNTHALALRLRLRLTFQQTPCELARLLRSACRAPCQVKDDNPKPDKRKPPSTHAIFG